MDNSVARRPICGSLPQESPQICTHLIGYQPVFRDSFIDAFETLAADGVDHVEAYIRHGVVCALSSDDPGIFGNDGLSYDFWEATMSWELGLAELKRLARNSIEYSAMTRPERERALRAWEAKWKTFIDELNQQRSAMERLAADGRR